MFRMGFLDIGNFHASQCSFVPTFPPSRKHHDRRLCPSCQFELRQSNPHPRRPPTEWWEQIVARRGEAVREIRWNGKTAAPATQRSSLNGVRKPQALISCFASGWAGGKQIVPRSLIRPRIGRCVTSGPPRLEVYRSPEDLLSLKGTGMDGQPRHSQPAGSCQKVANPWPMVVAFFLQSSMSSLPLAASHCNLPYLVVRGS